MEENELNKIPPYQRLQAVLSEGKSVKELKLTNKANRILDELIGDDKKNNLWIKIRDFFIEIDSMIFRKSKISNRYQKRDN